MADNTVDDERHDLRRQVADRGKVMALRTSKTIIRFIAYYGRIMRVQSLAEARNKYSCGKAASSRYCCNYDT
jgi:hypothetical protein